MERLRLEIDGMTCDHCVRAVTTALRALPGVTVEEVAIGRATVDFDPARTTPGQVVEAVADEGYAAFTVG